jgi:hypothetical protein
MDPASLVRDVLLGSTGLDEDALEVRVHEVGSMERLPEAGESARGLGAALHLDVSEDQKLDGVVAERAAPIPGELCLGLDDPGEDDGGYDCSSPHRKPPGTSPRSAASTYSR